MQAAEADRVAIKSQIMCDLSVVRPISVLRFWISEGLTQAQS